MCLLQSGWKVAACLSLVFASGCTDGKPGSDTGPVSNPVAFSITNNLDEARFLEWSYGARALFGVERQQGEEWEGVTTDAIYSAYYTTCDEETGCGRFCSYPEAPPSSVLQFEHGDSTGWTWDGLVVELAGEGCECPCYWAHRAEEGTYRVSAPVYASIDCGEAECPDPDSNGVISFGWGVLDVVAPAGEPTWYSEEFAVVFEGESVDISIE